MADRNIGIAHGVEAGNQPTEWLADVHRIAWTVGDQKRVGSGSDVVKVQNGRDVSISASAEALGRDKAITSGNIQLIQSGLEHAFEAGGLKEMNEFIKDVNDRLGPNSNIKLQRLDPTDPQQGQLLDTMQQTVAELNPNNPPQLVAGVRAVDRGGNPIKDSLLIAMVRASKGIPS